MATSLSPGVSGNNFIWDSHDHYQNFEVQHKPCIILKVKVINGRNISNGWAQDKFDIPDPYVTLRLKTAPGGRQQTRTINDNPNPVWNETFTFFLGSTSVKNVLELTLMEANPRVIKDQKTGTVYFQIHDRIREYGKWQSEVFNFSGKEEKSEIFVDFHMELGQKPTLRFSQFLCDAEKEFMRRRKLKACQALATLLGKDRRPKSVDETPTIAVIGSGGGFRAMTGYSGVFKALAKAGLLDCATYVCGLSGSAWYLSTLYSHPQWPQQLLLEEMQDELMNNIDKSLLRLLAPPSAMRYINSVIDKCRQGQPVSFTDFFGHMVGETLLKGRLDSRLTDQRDKIQEGNVPMPLYTCVHVKTDVCARSFQEWVEFSPYEIGMPKYGTFMDTELFGSKFFMGQLIRQHNEPPLHFLQGIWGSAFCVLFKRMLDNNRNMDPDQIIRQEMKLREDMKCQLQQSKDSDDSEDSSDSSDNDDHEDKKRKDKKGRKGQDCGSKCKDNEKCGFWKSLLKKMLENFSIDLLTTRAGRAAVVHNFLRGLPLQPRCPLTPESPLDQRVQEGDTFDGIFEMHPTHVKRMYMVDAGLTFNSPYPLVLRSQRGVDVILSFDFSGRETDKTPPIKELLMAEKWAKVNRVPFPPIDPTLVDSEDLKELYVFQDPNDPHCPVVLHFPLVNSNFKKFKAPGVPRKTQEELDFADFKIFDDKKIPYSSFNFTYTHHNFERLSRLTEFNMLHSVNQVKQVLAEVVAKKRQVIDGSVRLEMPRNKHKRKSREIKAASAMI